MSTSAIAQSLQTRHYSLQVIRSEGAPAGVKIPNLYAKVKLGDNPYSQQTQKVKGTSPSWNKTFTFSSSDIYTRFNIRVKRTSSFRFFKKSNPCIGLIDVSIIDLLKRCSEASNGEVKLDLHPPSGRLRSSGTIAIYLRLECTDKTAEMNAGADNTDVPATQLEVKTSSTAGLGPLPQNNRLETGQPSNNMANVRVDIDNTIAAILRRGITRSAMGKKFFTIGDMSSKLGEQSNLYRSLWAFCNKIGVFADIVDKLVVAHPYLNAVWQVTSSLFRVAEKKFENDAEVVELVCTASEAFDFACEVEELFDKVESLQRAIIGLLAQTTELCIFVRHYTSRRLAGQLLTLNDSSKKIAEFKECFRKIKGEFTAPLALQTAFVSARVSEEVQTLYLRQELEPDEKDASDRPECLPGTRGEYLDTIMDWAFSDSTQNILWLHGVAGSGKSTISMTIAEQCLRMNRRGAYLYFEREKSNPKSIVRSIAFWLASFDHSIAKYVSGAVKTNNGIAKASLSRQLEALLLQPLRAAAEDMIGPVIVILDALDECGPPAARRELLKLLAERIPELPRNFRFIITSRQEGDIESAFAKNPFVHLLKLDHESAASRYDVSTYFVHEMNVLFSTEEMKRSLPKDWPWGTNIQILVSTAGGLFVWASTAVKHITEYIITAFQRLDRLVRDVQSRGHGEFGLDALYSSILQSAQIPWDDEETKLRVSNILYLLLEVSTVLSTDDIDGILDLSSHSSSALIMSQLQSVLAYTPGSTSRIRALHASFAEFLKSDGQSQNPWYIDVANKREFIAKRCQESFDRMDRMLHFNICSIESSFTGNGCISDLQSRFEQNIPSELKNACVYWIQQLRILPYSLDFLPPIDRFLHRHLLSWLEVLTLMGRVKLASSALMETIKWVTGHNASCEPFMRDAWKLVNAFSIPISKSMPHIYLSMLPLAWPDSEVAAHYSRAFTSPSMVEMVGNRSQRAPPTVFRGHADQVNCISYSANGKRIVSGSADRTVIVWDAESGEIVAGPFKVHTDIVNSVGFSPDGKYIVSGSSDRLVIVWNTETGEVFRGPLEGHDDAVNCVSFSPDGKHVVSGSSDSTIIVWEVESAETSSVTLEGHLSEVLTVAYSPDGKYIVSGSVDRTLRVWDAQSSKIVKSPLKGHTKRVRSAMFSPDGKLVVSGSDDNRIRIWDLESGKLVTRPFEGHTRRIISAAFSPDGKHIFSSSRDSTMKVWVVESGETISSVGIDIVWSAISAPDGKRIAVGSCDGSIQVFDVHACEDAPGLFEGHTAEINSIAYSPDGTHIVSGSRDKTLIVWDVESGKVIVGPLKGHSGGINSVAYSSNGKYIVSGSDDGTLIVWDAGTGKIISGPFKGHMGWVLSVGFSPDGKWVVSGSYDKTIIVWDVKSSAIIVGPLKGHSDSVLAVGISPDGRYIVSGSDDNTLRVWGVESGEDILGPFKGHTSGVNSVEYSPDGKYIVSGSSDKTVRVWGAERGIMIAGPFDGHTDSVLSVRFSPDGKQVASGSGDSTIIIYDVGSGKATLGPLRGHAGGVSSVQFSPNGKHVASGSWGGLIRVWDVEHTDVLPVSTEASMYSSWTLSEDGWIVGQEGELLLWFPPDMRMSLCYHHNSAILGRRFFTKLHFTERGMGKNWQEYFDPLKLIVE